MIYVRACKDCGDPVGHLPQDGIKNLCDSCLIEKWEAWKGVCDVHLTMRCRCGDCSVMRGINAGDVIMFVEGWIDKHQRDGCGPVTRDEYRKIKVRQKREKP